MLLTIFPVHYWLFSYVIAIPFLWDLFFPQRNNCEMFIIFCSTPNKIRSSIGKQCDLMLNPSNIRRNRYQALNYRRCSEKNKSQERGIWCKTRQTSLWYERTFVFYCYTHSPWVTELDSIMASPPYERIAIKIIFNQLFHQISWNLVRIPPRLVLIIIHIQFLRIVHFR